MEGLLAMGPAKSSLVNFEVVLKCTVLKFGSERFQTWLQAPRAEMENSECCSCKF